LNGPSLFDARRSSWVKVLISLPSPLLARSAPVKSTSWIRGAGLFAIGGDRGQLGEAEVMVDLARDALARQAVGRVGVEDDVAVEDLGRIAIGLPRPKGAGAPMNWVAGRCRSSSRAQQTSVILL
jgi:hypothetical protein